LGKGTFLGWVGITGALGLGVVFPASCGGRSSLDGSASTACPPSALSGEPGSPVEYGERDIATALQRAGSSAVVRVVLGADASAQPALPLLAGPESYAILGDGAGGTLVVGRDPVGAMYGAFEVAERLRLNGAGVLPPDKPITGAPAMAYRSYNPYIVMPDPDGEACWYFLDASYWRDYLDEMAHARLNFLDLHGMYNLHTTLYPNALMWFATSTSFPDAGPPAGAGPSTAPPENERIRNAAMLETIVQMAHVRGIKVGFLSSRADLAIDATNTADQQIPFSQDDLVTYTREAVTDLLHKVANLDAIGVRVGEGNALPPFVAAGGGDLQGYLAGESAFYEASYLSAIRAAGTGVQFYTRSWLTDRAALEPLLADAPGPASANLLVKFSAEQFGPPFVPQDGDFINDGGPPNFYPSYLYENYLDDPPGKYTFIFHVWNSASFRFFRYASYARTARALAAMKALSPRVGGFTLQAAAAYGRQREYWLANADDVYSPWTFPRDELEAYLYGRLGYDPSTPEATLRDVLAQRVGTDALWDPEQAGSDIIAWIVSMQTCGPDSRDFAPQLEWIGSVGYWASPPLTGSKAPSDDCFSHDVGTADAGNQSLSYHGPIDRFAFASPYETAGDLVHGVATTRVSARDVAQIVLADATIAHQASAVAIDPRNPWARDVQRESVALADLGDYFAHKLAAATALAVYEQTGTPDYLTAATSETSTADHAWQQLARDTSYVKTFEDPYYPFPPPLDAQEVNGPFHWSEQSQYLALDPPSIAHAGSLATPPVFPLPAATVWLQAPRDDGPGLASLQVTPATPAATVWHVTITLAATPPAGTSVSVLWKPLTTTINWSAQPAAAVGNVYEADVPNLLPDGGPGNGGLFAAEVVPPPASGARGWRYPSPLTTVPYISIPP
jgi:hypothetical protein